MQKTIHSDSYRRLLGWLKKGRRDKRLTMRELAGQLHVRHTWIGKVEQGERRLDIVEYLRLCAALGLDPHEGLELLGAPGRSMQP